MGMQLTFTESRSSNTYKNAYHRVEEINTATTVDKRYTVEFGLAEETSEATLIEFARAFGIDLANVFFSKSISSPDSIEMVRAICSPIRI